MKRTTWISAGLALAVSLLLMTVTAQAQNFVPLRDVVQVAAGGAHTCALTTAGGVKCWGTNLGMDHSDEPGDVSVSIHPNPVDVPGLDSGVAAISAGVSHVCVLTTAGGVKCWGLNLWGQLGDGSTTHRPTPVDVPGLTRGVAAISASATHTCALTIGGGVKCWGYNASGQLGDGSTTSRLTPVDVSGLRSGVSAIASGSSHTCALTTGGGVKCWGMNASGQLGTGETSLGSHTPVNVLSLGSGVAAIDAGLWHTCALTTGGGVKCWGANYVSQLGNGSAGINQPAPVNVSGLGSGVVAISVGLVSEYTCALTTTGAVKCWGDNSSGQLGIGNDAEQSTPVSASGLSSGVASISAGGSHTCAVTTNGTVTCWGANTTGQLGDSSTSGQSHFVPKVVSGLGSGVATIGTGTRHACASTANGRVRCWGANGFGQLGLGTTDNQTAPREVPGLSGIAMVDTGRDHTCALTTAGGVKCWGNNLYGQLGNGNMTDQHTPVNVSGLSSGVVAISVGPTHTCALTTGGGVKCWGLSAVGELGDGSPGWTFRNTPVDVSGLDNGVMAISAGFQYTCALTTAGAVKCWGSNRGGLLGDGSNASWQPYPVNVSGLASGVVAISTGWSHVCALTTSGGLKCWGDNSSGELGDGSTTNRSIPADVPGLTSGMAAVSAGGYNTCALTIVGAAKCWGGNDNGQVGDGRMRYRVLEPADVQDLSSGVAAISAGAGYTCAVTTAGAAKCWGNHQYGQLGIGGRNYALPATVMVASEQDAPRAALRFDNANGPTGKAIERNAGTPVTFAWTTQNLPQGTTCTILRRPNNDYRASASPTSSGTRTDTNIHTWASGNRVFYLRCTNGTQSPDITLTITPPSTAPSATLRFDNANGPTSKTIERNSGTPVTFAWSTRNLPQGTTCTILRRPNDDYRANASPIASGARTDANIHTWATGNRVFYLRCSNGTQSPDITLTITPPSTAPSATLRFDSANGPTNKTIARHSGTSVTFAWSTRNLPQGTTCTILRRPNDDYRASASPIASGTRTATTIHTWATGSRAFYLRCTDGTQSPDITLTITPPSTARSIAGTVPVHMQALLGNGEATLIDDTVSMAGKSVAAKTLPSFA